MVRWSSGGRRAIAVLIAATLALGCRAKAKDKTNDPTNVVDDDLSTVEDGSDTAAAETDSQLITSSLVAASPGSVGLATLSPSDLNFETLGDGAKAIYFPRNCLVVAPEGDQGAKYTFTGCLGPNGLRVLKGELKVTYKAEQLPSGGGQLTLDLTATNLQVNKATLDWHATAVITADPNNANRTMSWKAQLSGTTARGHSFSRTNQHTITWTLGESCFALDGTADGEVNQRQIHTEIQNFRRCRRACPDPNGKIVITNVTKDKTYELDYDGTDHATYTDPKGRTQSIPLLCGQ